MVNDGAALLDQPPEQVSPQLARAYLATADRPTALRVLRLFAPEALRRPEVAELLEAHHRPGAYIHRALPGPPGRAGPDAPTPLQE